MKTLHGLFFVVMATLFSVDRSQQTNLDALLSGTAQKAEISVFYEVDCPDSKHFIAKQLKPTWEDLADFVTIRLFPYGKASETYVPSTGRWTFRCQHRAHECQGNLIASCALNIYKNTSESLPFVFCQMDASRDSVSDAQDCAFKNDLDWNRISECVSGNEGNGFQHQIALQTPKLKYAFVPWIYVNNRKGPENNFNANEDLRKLVCDEIPGTKPSVCSTK